MIYSNLSSHISLVDLGNLRLTWPRLSAAGRPSGYSAGGTPCSGRWSSAGTAVRAEATPKHGAAASSAAGLLLLVRAAAGRWRIKAVRRPEAGANRQTDNAYRGATASCRTRRVKSAGGRHALALQRGSKSASGGAGRCSASVARPPAADRLRGGRRRRARRGPARPAAGPSRGRACCGSRRGGRGWHAPAARSGGGRGGGCVAAAAAGGCRGCGGGACGSGSAAPTATWLRDRVQVLVEVVETCSKSNDFYKMLFLFWYS